MKKIRLLALLGFILLSSACSVLLDFNECENDSDCDGATCNDGVCERAECESPSDCSGENVACIKNGCVELEDRCEVPFDSEIDDDPVFHVGALFPLTGRNGDKGNATARGAQVAFNQINLTTNGIDGKRVGMVLCDTENNEDVAVEVARYMKDILGLNAFLGSIGSDETLDVANEVIIPGDAILISPASTSPQISSLDDDDLIWRTIGSDALQGPAMAKLIQQQAFSNFIVMSADTTYGQGLFDAFSNAGVFSASEFDLVQYKVDANGDADAESFTTRMSDLLSEKDPDAIVILGSVESQQIIFSLETAFFAADEMVNPMWVLSEAGRDLALIESSNFDDVRERIIGTVIRQNDSQVFQNFTTRFAAEHSLQADDHPFADKAYDAAFALTLAIAASEKLFDGTGSDYAPFLRKMVDGSTYSPGDDFAAAISNLRGDGINFEGASGPIDFDSNGDVDSTVIQWSIENNNFVDGAALN